MDFCKVLAEVTIEGLTTLGKAPATGTYVCAAAAVNPLTTAASPVVCAGMVAATTVGKWIDNAGPATSEVAKEVVERGCTFVVSFGEQKVKLMIVDVKENYKAQNRDMAKAKQQIKALNSRQGLMWLMNYLTRMPTF
jgi:hypothetical protein